MVIEHRVRGWPESRVPRLRDLMYFSSIPSWSQVIFLTIAICIALVIGNMVELVKTTGPGVRWASAQVLVPLHTSWGTLGASVSNAVHVCKRSRVCAWIKCTPFGGGCGHGLNEIMHVKRVASANKGLHHHASCLLVSKVVSIGGYRCCPGYRAICKEWCHDLLSK